MQIFRERQKQRVADKIHMSPPTHPPLLLLPSCFLSLIFFSSSRLCLLPRIDCFLTRASLSPLSSLRLFLHHANQGGREDKNRKKASRRTVPVPARPLPKRLSILSSPKTVYVAHPRSLCSLVSFHVMDKLCLAASCVGRQRASNHCLFFFFFLFFFFESRKLAHTQQGNKRTRRDNKCLHCPTSPCGTKTILHN